MAAALVVYFAAHLPFLAPSLEDLDSINFALGLREFDVAQHQPHPPGSAGYIGLGRASLVVIEAVAPALPPLRAETLALAICSAIAGVLAVAGAYGVYRASAPHSARGATALLAVAPLFWLSALRPMSDMPGLAAALVTQALLLRGLADARFALLGALAAGLAAGIRVQTIWLTAPVVAVMLWRRRADGLWLVRGVLVAGLVGVLAWLIPLLVASGGLDRYLSALGSQAGEDFAWVDMLWANPTPRRLASSLYEAFVMPWGALPLAVLVLAAAAVGAIVTLLRERQGLLLMALAFAPYVVFHLLFQETAHVRYALPVVVPVVWLAAQACAAAGRAAPVLHAAVIVFALFVTARTAVAYRSEPHAAFRAIADMNRAAPVERPAALFAHYAMRRPLQIWTPAGVTFVEPPSTNEWKGLIDYWRGGGTAPVWFLADARRTDLALVDPQSRHAVTTYHWPAADHAELGGARPSHVDWYRFSPPGWFAGEGWSLTPELGGVTRLTGTGVDRRPIDAMVRRRLERALAIVGARHLGTASDGGVSFTLAVDGRELDRWELDPSRGPNVLRVLELPAGTLAGAGDYGRLTISAAALTPGAPTPPVAIRQFDVQSDTGLIHAFDEGWHEEEYENTTGLRWRWTSERSVLRILPPQGVRLRLVGESPLKYFDAPPRVRVTAGGRVIAEFSPAADFDWTVPVSASDVKNANGFLAIETDPVYLPGAAEGTADRRRLGLRLFQMEVGQALP